MPERKKFARTAQEARKGSVQPRNSHTVEPSLFLFQTERSEKTLSTPEDSSPQLRPIPCRTLRSQITFKGMSYVPLLWVLDEGVLPFAGSIHFQDFWLLQQNAFNMVLASDPTL
jgi:hypothetical protein